jgi:hypothetical protein
VETTVWAVDAFLLRYKLEIDSDVHLVLVDTGGCSMIAEIPAPECVGSSSPFLPAIRTVRRTFAARFHPTDFWQRPKIRVHVRGVGFFDFRHGQSGVAPNRRWRSSAKRSDDEMWGAAVVVIVPPSHPTSE